MRERRVTRGKRYTRSCVFLTVTRGFASTSFYCSSEWAEWVGLMVKLGIRIKLVKPQPV